MQAIFEIYRNSLKCLTDIIFSNSIFSWLDNQYCIISINIEKGIEIFSYNCFIRFFNLSDYRM